MVDLTQSICQDEHGKGFQNCPLFVLSTCHWHVWRAPALLTMSLQAPTLHYRGRWSHYYYYIFSDLFFLNQRWSPPLRLQVSHCSTFRITCDVPSTAVFCSESIECFPGADSKFFLKLLVTIPVAPVITGIIVHFRFHIHCTGWGKITSLNFKKNNKKKLFEIQKFYFWILKLQHGKF